jgi:hypothetical protein
MARILRRLQGRLLYMPQLHQSKAIDVLSTVLSASNSGAAGTAAVQKVGRHV